MTAFKMTTELQLKRGRKPLPIGERKVPISARISPKADKRMSKDVAKLKVTVGLYLSQVLENHNVKVKP